ncbi:MAG: DNA/RNA nuclease SfsA [Clostridia bacterium]|nr:DNA/RNA nuclease SfsA [Clostridia bacterium]
MKLYHHIHEAAFLYRSNRFIAHCLLNGEEVVCHVKNTGRCRELLIPGCTVWLEESNDPKRKTRFDLVCVSSRGYVVNMDSQAPNRVFEEWAAAGGLGFVPDTLKREVTFGQSRFDFSLQHDGKAGFAEVKGVTLFDDENRAFFPDAPTERGVKHIRELIAAKEADYESAICFVLQRDNIISVSPNDITHPAFGDTLRLAHSRGVNIIGAVCHTTPDTLTITHTVPVIL